MMTIGRLHAAALVSTVALIAVTWRTPQGLYSDPAQHFYAAREFHAGSAPNVLTRVGPLPRDITRDTTEWITWWAPGPALLTYPAIAAGASFGAATRVLVIFALLVGAVGWASWIARFRLPVPIAIPLVVALPWMRFASNNLFLFSAELFTFAVVPWALTTTDALAHRWSEGYRASPRLLVAVGLLLGIPYALKYSIVLVMLGGIAFLGIVTLERFRARSRELRTRAIADYLLVCVAFLAPVLALTALNRVHAAASNLVSASVAVHLRWETLAWAAAAPVLALADFDSPLHYVLLRPNHPLISEQRWLLAPALFGAPLLAWLLATRTAWTRTGLLAICVSAVSLVCVIAIWTLTPAVSYESRHIAGAAIALLPVALVAGLTRWRNGGTATRVLLAGAGLVFVALPLLYGGLSVIGKVRRTPQSAALGPSGFYNAILSTADPGGCVQWAMSGVDTVRDVWYVADPITALDLPGRAIVSGADFTPGRGMTPGADFMSLDDLQARRYYTSRSVRVHVLLSPRFEENGKADAIRGSFAGAIDWHSSTRSGCNYALWTAVIAQTPGRPSSAIAPPMMNRSRSAYEGKSSR